MCIFQSGELSVAGPPGLDFEDVNFYEITFTATDTNGLTTDFVLDFTVIDGPDPPEILNLPDTVSIHENVTTGVPIFTIEAEDIDGDPIIYDITAYPDQGQFYLAEVDGESVNMSFTFHLLQSDNRLPLRSKRHD